MRWPCVIWVALAASACGDPDVAKLEKVKAAVCACKTPSCAEAAMKDVPKGEVQASHRAQVVARDMLDCLAKVYESERPATGPDAPSAPGSAAPASAGTH